MLHGLARQLAQSPVKSAKKKKDLGGEFLALEEHRRAWPQEQQGRQRLIAARAGQARDSAARGQSWQSGHDSAERSQTLLA